jgi:large subunit ribosomal protein L25
MENLINVEPRPTSGKGAVRKIRKAGRLPGVLYGHKQKPLSFSVDPLVLKKTIISSGRGRNTVFRVKGLDRDVLALVKDTQIDPLRRDLVHLDLIEVREDEDVPVEVAVELVGKPLGVVDGGILQPVRRSVRIFCKPLAIPHKIEIDVTPLRIGEAIHVRDVNFPAGTRAAIPGHLTICTVVAPMAEEKPAAEAAAVEGAVPAEGAAAAAPAEGAAAAPAAPDKKEKKEEKK